VPATLTRYIDINNNAELNKFGLHNGPPNDRNNLSEKWEGMALVPALDPDNPNDFFLFITNDNDFITQNGYQVGAAYKDASGVEVDTMILVYRVTLPVNSMWSLNRLFPVRPSLLMGGLAPILPWGRCQL
jgi:hypothetical protein